MLFERMKQKKYERRNLEQYAIQSERFIRECRERISKIKESHAVQTIAKEISKNGSPKNFTVNTYGIRGEFGSILFEDLGLCDLSAKKIKLESFPRCEMKLGQGLSEWFESFKKNNTDIFGLQIVDEGVDYNNYVVYLNECAVVGCAICWKLNTVYDYNFDYTSVLFKKRQKLSNWE